MTTSEILAPHLTYQFKIEFIDADTKQPTHFSRSIACQLLSLKDLILFNVADGVIDPSPITLIVEHDLGNVALKGLFELYKKTQRTDVLIHLLNGTSGIITTYNVHDVSVCSIQQLDLDYADASDKDILATISTSAADYDFHIDKLNDFAQVAYKILKSISVSIFSKDRTIKTNKFTVVLKHSGITVEFPE